jgi:hypothetical protein
VSTTIKLSHLTRSLFWDAYAMAAQAEAASPEAQAAAHTEFALWDRAIADGLAHDPDPEQG